MRPIDRDRKFERERSILFDYEDEEDGGDEDDEEFLKAR